MTGLLDGSVTVDHRLLTESGRKQIVQEQKDSLENIKELTHTISDTYSGINNGINITKTIERERAQLTSEEKALFDQAILEYIHTYKLNGTESLAPVAGAAVVTAAEETAIAATGAAILCTRTPACFRAVGAVMAAAGLEILSEEDRKKATTPAPKPLPSTSGNSATGGPSNGGDEKEKKDVGNQSKKMSDKQIADLVGNPRWHKTSLKSRIVSAYARELRGSNNFDFYRDPKTGNIFIKGNQSNNMVKIDISRFLK